MTQLELQVELEKFKGTLEGKNIDELRSLEEGLIKEIEDFNKEVEALEYDLPEENFTEVAQAIQSLLDKETVQWQFTLMMVGMYDFWNEYRGKISYTQLDAVLNRLGGMQFTGYEDWNKVIVINKYFEPLRDLYYETTSKVFLMANKHNAIMEKLQLLTPVTGPQAEA